MRKLAAARPPAKAGGGEAASQNARPGRAWYIDLALRMKSTKPESEAAPSAPTADVALVHAVDPDGSVHVIRRRGEQVELGALQPVREGTPIHGEVVSLKPRPQCPLLCDVEVLYTPPPAPKPPALSASRSEPRKGPAQVATDRYRDNWDSIWRKKAEVLN